MCANGNNDIVTRTTFKYYFLIRSTFEVYCEQPINPYLEVVSTIHKKNAQNVLLVSSLGHFNE